MSSPAPNDALNEGPPNPHRWWALAALSLSGLVLGFDITILNVALPTLAADIDASTTEQQWIVDAFLVVFAAAMLPAGLLGDRFGRRRMLVVGMLALLVGSAAGSLVDTAGPLIVARVVMGAGAALMAPLALSILPGLFAPAERAKAVAAVSAAMAVGMPLGPLIGGWLLDHYWWGSIFLVNVPLAAIGIVACLLLVPESRDPATPRVDALSTTLSIVGLAALVFGVIEGPSRDWNHPLVLVTLIGSVPLLAALFVRERRRLHPMLDIGLMRNRGFALSVMTAAATTLILAGLLFVVPQYLQAVRGENAMTTGYQLMPMMAGLLVGARACVPLTKAFGHRVIIAIGLGLLACAGVLGSTTDSGSGYGLAAAWLTIVGLGTGLAQVPAMEAALQHLPPERSGVGSGLLMTLRQVASAIGVALMGSLLNQAYRAGVDIDGLPQAALDTARESVVAAHLIAGQVGGPLGAELTAAANEAFIDGMSLTLMVCAAASVAAAVLVLWLLPALPRQQAGNETGAVIDEATTNEATVGTSVGTTESSPAAAAQTTIEDRNSSNGSRPRSDNGLAPTEADRSERVG